MLEPGEIYTALHQRLQLLDGIVVAHDSDDLNRSEDTRCR
jgi:hypothetical protein